MTTIDIDELPDELRTKDWHQWAKKIHFYYVANTPFTEYFDDKELSKKVDLKIFIDTLYKNKVLVVEDEIDFLLIAELYRAISETSSIRILTLDNGKIIDNYNVEQFHLRFLKSRMMEFLTDKTGIGEYSTFTEFGEQIAKQGNPKGRLNSKYISQKIIDYNKVNSLGGVAMSFISEDDEFDILKMPAFTEAYEKALQDAELKPLQAAVDNIVDNQTFETVKIKPSSFY